MEIPIEILLNIFRYLDGKTLITCKKACRHWSELISYYDDIIWPTICHVDFDTTTNNRFWSCQFPNPTSLLSKQPTWQDMYRITFNWYNKYTRGFYPMTTTTTTKQPCIVIGTPQESNIFTNLSISFDRRIIRSNPTYNHLVIQSPQTKQSSILEIPVNTNHDIVCHYSLPSSPYLVTGASNGTVVLWNLSTKSLVRHWHGHRGRVLCVSMNNSVVVSGGSDSIIRVWDILEGGEWTNHHRPARRGMIDISSYLSNNNVWFQGVGEIAVNRHLIACAPDASGPILVFSLLTGSLVYELRVHAEQESTAFRRLCLTPYFLLTRSQLANKDTTYPIVPTGENAVSQRRQLEPSFGYRMTLSDVEGPSHATPYQLYQYYQNAERKTQHIPPTSACIDVWDLQTGKIAYRLVPHLKDPYQHYAINDIRVSPDYSKVFADIVLRGTGEPLLYCWDFSIKNAQPQPQDFDITELDQSSSAWVCYM